MKENESKNSHKSAKVGQVADKDDAGGKHRQRSNARKNLNKGSKSAASNIKLPCDSAAEFDSLSLGDDNEVSQWHNSCTQAKKTEANGSSQFLEFSPPDSFQLPFCGLSDESDNVDSRTFKFCPESLVSLNLNESQDVESTEHIETVISLVEGLIGRGEFNPKSASAAVRIPEVSVRIVPPQLRSLLWRVNLPTLGQPPSSFTIVDDYCPDLDDSALQVNRENCEKVWRYLSGKTEISETFLDLLSSTVCQTVEFSGDLETNFSLTVVALVAFFSCSQSMKVTEWYKKDVLRNEVLKNFRIMIFAIVRNWRNELDFDDVNEKETTRRPLSGLSGGAWTDRVPPLVLLRRQMILSKLLSFHDPKLGLYLTQENKHWNPEQCISTVRKESKWISSTFVSHIHESRFFNEYAVQFCSELPSKYLFGVLTRTDDISAESMQKVWDSVIFSRKTPQEMSFFFAIAALMLNRDDIMKASDTQVPLKEAFSNVFQSRNLIEKFIALAEKLSSLTPESISAWLKEKELHLSYPSEDDMEAFEAECASARTRQLDISSKDTTKLANRSTSSEAGDVAIADPKDDTLQKGLASSASESDTGSPKSLTGSGFFSILKSRVSTDLPSLINFKALQSSLIGITAQRPNLTRHLVKIHGNNSKPLGLTLNAGRHGLEVISVEEDSIAAKTQMIYPGDVIMSVNDILTLFVSGDEAYSLLELQERPFYLTVGSTQEGVDDEKSLSTHKFCPGIEKVLHEFYVQNDLMGSKKVSETLRLYSHNESLLLDRLSKRYQVRVNGNPCFSPTSVLCMPINPLDVLESIRFGTGREECSADNKVEKMLVVDVRSAEEVEQTGRISSGLHVDPLSIDSDSAKKMFRDMFLPLRGSLIIVLMASGNDALVERFDSRRWRTLRKIDRWAIDFIASQLLELEIPYVGFVDGGFLGLYSVLRELEGDEDDFLINVPGHPGALLKSYEAYLESRKLEQREFSKLLCGKLKTKSEPSLTPENSNTWASTASKDDFRNEYIWA